MRTTSAVLSFVLSVAAGCSASRPESQEHLLRIYFVNHSREAMDMKMVAGTPPPFLLYSVDRKIVTLTPEKTAMEQLLAGPRGDEIPEGYSTTLEGLHLKDFRVGGDTAYVYLEGGAQFSGLLTAPRLRAQVERTLKEFPAIRVVEIWINEGRDFDSLK